MRRRRIVVSQAAPLCHLNAINHVVVVVGAVARSLAVASGLASALRCAQGANMRPGSLLGLLFAVRFASRFPVIGFYERWSSDKNADTWISVITYPSSSVFA